MRVQNERNRSIGAGVMVVAGLDPACRTADIHLGHEILTSNDVYDARERGSQIWGYCGRAAAANLTLPLKKPIAM
jgi:hypothetical protein